MPAGISFNHVASLLITLYTIYASDACQMFLFFDSFQAPNDNVYLGLDFKGEYIRFRFLWNYMLWFVTCCVC